MMGPTIKQATAILLLPSSTTFTASTVFTVRQAGTEELVDEAGDNEEEGTLDEKFELEIPEED